jgi:hypothetical protein
MELRTQNWSVEPLEVDLVESSFFDDRARFPEGSIAFDCALLMRDLAHEWHARPQLAARAPRPGWCRRSTGRSGRGPLPARHLAAPPPNCGGGAHACMGAPVHGAARGKSRAATRGCPYEHCGAKGRIWNLGKGGPVTRVCPILSGRPGGARMPRQPQARRILPTHAREPVRGSATGDADGNARHGKGRADTQVSPGSEQRRTRAR